MNLRRGRTWDRCTAFFRWWSVVLAALAVALGQPAMAEAEPRRVVSINVCTDQLAMLVAGAGQLHSVSHLALDPHTSAMVREARRFTINHGLAEEIFLLKPDLVLAGTYTPRSTIDLLRRLGFRVEQFAPSDSFEDVRAQLERMGALLKREARAASLVAELDDGLAQLAKLPPSGKRAVTYSSNSFATGSGTLSDAVLKAAGLQNVAAELGIVGGARLSLEIVIAAKPDMIVTGAGSYDLPALAQENFRHPAFRKFVGDDRQIAVPDASWVCGAPFTLAAARILQDAAAR